MRINLGRKIKKNFLFGSFNPDDHSSAIFSSHRCIDALVTCWLLNRTTVIPIQMKGKSKSPTKLSDFLSIPRSETLDHSHQSLVKVPTCKDPSLKKLCLNNNRIADLISIESYSDLKELDISHNNIRSWKQLRRVSRTLQVLNIEGNPLQSQPNHLYNLVFTFPNIRKINRLMLNENLRRDIIECQRIISHKLLHWMIQLNRMDQRLTRTFCSPQLRIDNMDDYHAALEVLENERKYLVSQYDPLFKFRNESLFIKNTQLKDLLEKQEKISFSTSEREAVQENFFQYLISVITKVNKSIVEYLLSEITLADSTSQKQLSGNDTLLYKEMFHHFKRMWLDQLSPLANNVMSSIEQEYSDVFPFYSLQEVYVECVYQSFIDMLQSNIKKIDESLEHIVRSQPRDLRKRKSLEVKYIGDGSQRLTWMSDNSFRKTHLQQQETERQVQDTKDDSDYRALCGVLSEVGNRKLKRKAFQQLKKCRPKITADEISYFCFKMSAITTKPILQSFVEIQDYIFQCRLIENHYWNRRLKLLAFEELKRMLYNRQLRMEILGSLMAKKERATRMILAYSLKRWKLLSSKTLRYIEGVRRSVSKKKDSIEEQYRKVVQERLGGRMRASTLTTKSLRPR